MKKKLLRILPLVIIVGLVVAIPASTQVFRRSTAVDAESVNLRLLVLVNRMEMTTEQMEEIREILSGVLSEREARELRAAELEEQMIAFNGTAEELDGILEVFRLETTEQLEGSQERVADAIDRIKEILSLKQGEVLAEALPGLLGDTLQLHAMQGSAGLQRGQSMGRMMLPGRMGGQSDNDMPGRILEQLEERFEGRAEVFDGLRDRLGSFFGRSADDEDEDLGAMRGRMGLQLGGRGLMGRGGLSGPQTQAGCMDLQGEFLRGPAGSQGADVIEQLVEVLDLKIEAME